MTTSAEAATVGSERRPLHVLVVDDSVFIRGMIAKWLDEEGVGVVATAADGSQAVRKLEAFPADVITLDLEMPVLSGFDAIPQLLKLRPAVRIIVVSTLSLKGAQATLRAMELGAADFLPKPQPGEKEAFHRNIVAKVRALGGARRASSASPVKAAPRPVPVRPAGTAKPAAGTPRIIAIGASTGGPDALTRLLRAIGPGVRTPILVCQHMPATFTAILAANLSRQTGLDCREGVEGEPVQPGRVYIAPGDRHMQVENGAQGPAIRLSTAPPEHFCRPAVDPLFRSVAKVYGNRAFAIVLTGMGSDGAVGAAALSQAGARIAVQDEASSVVWGMPGAVAKAGLADVIQPVDGLADLVRSVCS